jgi:pyruvate/2-oxoglutarate dehydrogenase complex dihydrolipoamide dehydrogenase (E3) component
MTMGDNDLYDAIIIGAGQSGGPLSGALAGAGWKTAIIERKYVGGSCINYGCTPTKTMVASARVAYLAKRAGDYGVMTGDVEVDMVRIRQRKRDIVKSFREGSLNRIVNSEAELIRGEAHFTGPREIEVQLNSGNSRSLTGEHIFINTGAAPRIPEFQGLANVPYLNSTTIMELDQVPRHLIIVGGGYIGAEFGQMFRRFGSQVTIIQKNDQLLTHEDPDVAGEVLSIFKEDGIDVRLNTTPFSVVQDVDGTLHLTLEGPDGKRDTISGSHLLIAAGRTPSSEALNLSVAGIETDQRGHIQVDDQLRTSVEGVYAMGDVKGGPAFTHISYDDYRILKTNLLDGGSASISNRMVPYTVFIDPQLGRVGLTEKQANRQGIRYKVASMPMNYVSRALEVDEPRGLMKALVDPDSQRILGCAILGIQGGEIMAIIQVAMMGNLPYTALRDGIFTHPTLAEAMNNLFGMLD